MLVDTFPPQQRGQALAMYGLTVILAPTIGPILGGAITDHYSWHWIFLINVPVGVLSLVLVQIFVAEPPLLRQERAERWRRGIRMDLVGWVLIALALGCLELTMDRGEREDWFSSPLISISASLCAVSFLAFVVWELTRSEPLLDMRLYRNRNFAVASLVMAIIGVILFGTTQFLPQLLQEVLGYTATDAGLAMTLGGVATFIAMPFAGVLSGKVQPRFLLGAALAVQVFALWNMTRFSTGMSLMDAAWGRVWQAIGMPFLFVPLANAAYVDLPPERSNQASAMLNVARNLGGTIGISLVQSLLATREQIHQSRLAEGLEPLNLNYGDAVSTITRNLTAQGFSAAEAAQAALGQIYHMAQQQAAMLAFIDCFKVLMIFVALVFPTVWVLKHTPVGPRPAPAAIRAEARP
jgi:DHA2 family multidrug resistance protein